MLTIAEDFILLALDPKTGDFRRLQTEYLHAGLIGASVMELALWERTDSDIENVWVLDAKPTGYHSLDLVLAAMAQPGFPLRDGQGHRRADAAGRAGGTGRALEAPCPEHPGDDGSAQHAAPQGDAPHDPAIPPR